VLENLYAPPPFPRRVSCAPAEVGVLASTDGVSRRCYSCGTAPDLDRLPPSCPLHPGSGAPLPWAVYGCNESIARRGWPVKCEIPRDSAVDNGGRPGGYWRDVPRRFISSTAWSSARTWPVVASTSTCPMGPRGAWEREVTKAPKRQTSWPADWVRSGWSAITMLPTRSTSQRLAVRRAVRSSTAAQVPGTCRASLRQRKRLGQTAVLGRELVREVPGT
jgi:hypothetical protein